MPKVNVVDRKDCLSFADLTKSQKTFVVRLMELHPEYKTETDLGWKQLHAAYFEMRDQRSATNEKIGCPIWIQKANIVGRGTYQMPWPTAQELSDFQNAKSAPKAPAAKVQKAAAGKKRLEKLLETKQAVQDSDVEDFNKILKDAGIEV